MKTVLLLAVVILISSNAYSSDPQVGLMGIYLDEGRNNNCYWGNTQYVQMEMWIWCRPGDNGMICTEFKLSRYSYGDYFVIPMYEFTNPAISYESGSLWDGVSVCFCDCQYDWVWTHRHSIFLWATSGVSIWAEKLPDSDMLRFKTCQPGYPEEQAYSSYLCINDGWCCYG